MAIVVQHCFKKNLRKFNFTFCVKVNFLFRVLKCLFFIYDNTQKFAQENVDWRFTWWKMVISDVMKESPFYGLGLGSDISTEFHANYFQTGIDNTDVIIARYPHNILITVLGRLGIIGIIIFLLGF